MLFLQVFLTMLAIPSLLLAGLLQERQRAEHDVREREAQYRSIVESIGDGVLITDLAQVVVAADPALLRLTGTASRRCSPPTRDSSCTSTTCSPSTPS